MFVYVCRLDGEDGAVGRLKAESELDAAETFVQRLYRRHHEAARPGRLPELDFDAGVTVRVRASAAPPRLERRFRVRVALVPEAIGEEV